MSRIGKLPIPIPPDVGVNIDGSEVNVKGPKGDLSRHFHHGVTIISRDGMLVVSPNGNTKLHHALHGLSRSLLANMVEGVTKGFEKNLELSGIGYKAQKAGDNLVINVGFSHPVNFSPPSGISLTVDGINRIKVIGADKELVGEVAARIRAIRPPDHYVGKGIKYMGEKLRLKAGKAGKAAGKKLR